MNPTAVSPPRRATRLYRMLALIAGVAVYGAVTAVAVAKQMRHWVQLIDLAQYLILLPALYFGLRESGKEPQSSGDNSANLHWRHIAILCGVFLVGITAASATLRGLIGIDDSAYRFQALILASGHLTAPAPPVGLGFSNQGHGPVRYNQHIVSGERWYTKYPIGWPLVAAIPETMGLGWLINPPLVIGILILTALLARQFFPEPSTAVIAVAILVLSPFFFEVGLFGPHALDGLLVAAATFLCVGGLRKRSLRHFIGMFVLLALGVHVRPFTTLLITVILSGYALVAAKSDWTFLWRLFLVVTVAAVLMASSLLIYDFVYTGHVLVSPYAQYRGLAVPSEISASPLEIIRNLNAIWRPSVQGSIAFFFPLVFPLAILGYWRRRHSRDIHLLAAVFLVLVAGHLLQREPSSSLFGERYWFEAYFALVILAAEGAKVAVSTLKPWRESLIWAMAAVAAVQILVTASVCASLKSVSTPLRAVAKAARSVDCNRCVVFLSDTPPYFYGEHLNLNLPDWQDERVFFAVDPGPEGRDAWTRMLNRERWAVVTYDPQKRSGYLVGSSGGE